VIAAIAQTQAILAGGQGLAAGATALFVNALIATQMQGGAGSMILWTLAGPLIGAAIGAVNGLLIGRCRLSSTAVTLATSFITGGFTLALLDSPPPDLPAGFAGLLAHEIGLPLPFLLVLLLLLVAAGLDRSPLAGRLKGLSNATSEDRRRLVVLAYTLAGAGYGLSGVFLTAELGTADPIFGSPSLLEIYAAVALGGSVPLLRHGSSLGSALGALAVSAAVNLLLPVGLPDYAAPAVDGLLLLLGLGIAGRTGDPAIPPQPQARGHGGLPLWLGLALVLAALTARGGLGFLSSDLLLALIIAGVLALAQGIVVMSGQIDLSLSALAALAGLATVSLTQGADPAAAWVLPLVLIGGLLVGLANGGLGRLFKAPRVLVTLAIAGILQTGAVFLTFARPTGFAPPVLTDFMTGSGGGWAPAVAILGALLLAMILALSRGGAASRLRGGAPLLNHGLAGLLAAAGGILLAGYGIGSRIGVVDPYLLPSFLAIQLTVLAIGAEGGRPFGLIAAVPLVFGLDTLLLGFGLSYPMRVVALGLCLMAATLLKGSMVRTAVPPPYSA